MGGSQASPSFETPRFTPPPDTAMEFVTESSDESSGLPPCPPPVVMATLHLGQDATTIEGYSLSIASNATDAHIYYQMGEGVPVVQHRTDNTVWLPPDDSSRVSMKVCASAPGFKPTIIDYTLAKTEKRLMLWRAQQRAQFLANGVPKRMITNLGLSKVGISGSVDFAEFDRMVLNGNFSPDQMRAVFDRFDASEDGKINIREYVEYVSENQEFFANLNHKEVMDQNQIDDVLASMHSAFHSIRGLEGNFDIDTGTGGGHVLSLAMQALAKSKRIMEVATKCDTPEFAEKAQQAMLALKESLVYRTFEWTQDCEQVVQEVVLVGSWTEWLTYHPMSLEADDEHPSYGKKWRVAVRLAPGRHEFKFVVDGIWMKSYEYEVTDDGVGTDGNTSLCVEPPFDLLL